MQRGDRVGGRFEILGEAARGGMGTVFRARDAKLRRDVALKIVAASDAEDAARFAREAAVLAQVRHPNIVEYVTHGAVPGGPQYLVMEWVEGETLSHRLASGSVTPREALAIASQIAGALAALHAAKIVHRDVKPSNLMLVQDHVKLVDFGIARVAHGGDRLTRTGSFVGTAGYMAPEQARGDTDVDERADVFALGCVLYECIAGRPVYRGDSALALRAKVLLHDPPRLRTIAAGVTDELDGLVARMLARVTASRPTAAEVAQALVTVPPPDAAVPSGERNIAETESSGPGALGPPACVVLIALDDDDEVAAAMRVIGETASTMAVGFDGCVIATRTELADAAELALALHARFPTAAVAVAKGRSESEAVDRSARLLEQLDIAAAAGAPTAGAWIDPESARALTAFAIDRIAGHNRLRGGAS
jgi:eukaryotic-like serine/threonine-protein kinase